MSTSIACSKTLQRSLLAVHCTHPLGTPQAGRGRYTIARRTSSERPRLGVAARATPTSGPAHQQQENLRRVAQRCSRCARMRRGARGGGLVSVHEGPRRQQRDAPGGGLVAQPRLQRVLGPLRRLQRALQLLRGYRVRRKYLPEGLLRGARGQLHARMRSSAQGRCMHAQGDDAFVGGGLCRGAAAAEQMRCVVRPRSWAQRCVMALANPSITCCGRGIMLCRPHTGCSASRAVSGCNRGKAHTTQGSMSGSHDSNAVVTGSGGPEA